MRNESNKSELFIILDKGIYTINYGIVHVSAFRVKYNFFPNLECKTFVKLSNFPVNLEVNDIEMLEKFITLVYDKSLCTKTVGAARKLLKKFV